MRSAPDTAVVALSSDVAVVDVSLTIVPSTIQQVGKPTCHMTVAHCCWSCSSGGRQKPGLAEASIVQTAHIPLPNLAPRLSFGCRTHLICQGCFPNAGEVGVLRFAVTNTGNLTVTGLTLDVPNVFMPLNCTLGSRPYLIAPATATILSPGAVLQCNGSHTVELQDIEDGDHTVTVRAIDEGSGLNVYKDLIVRSQQRPQVTVQVQEQECSLLPAQAGEC